MGFLVKAVTSVIKAVVGVVSKVVGAIFGFSTGKKTVAKAKSVGTLNKSLDPEAYRKIVLGAPAAPLDVRFWEVWGASGANYDEVLALAGHQINAVKELYFEDALAIAADNTVQARYVGVVTRTINLGTVGQAALAVGSGTQWTAAATFDGCPHIKLAWTPDEKKLPNGIPSRYTQVVEGALVYDPRRDSTAGGSGTHRANDRSTWSYATLDANGVPIGRNNALQALWYLLGWTVPTKDVSGTVTGSALTCGRGVDPQDINMSTFIAGANACEVAGYYTDLVLSTQDSHTSNEDKITCDGLIGRLIDPGGLWSYYANVNDTSNIAVELTDADILEGTSVTWNEFKPMSEQYNQVSGKFINPSATTLYQAFPYPLVRDATYEANLGRKVRKPQDFEQVLDNNLAQRLARLLLNEGQYQGEYSAGFNYRALKAQAWSVVRYTSERFNWVKLFRVYRYDLSTNAGVGMMLREIDASIWSAGTVNAALSPGTGAKYDPNQLVAVTGLTAAQYSVVGPGATPSIADGCNVAWTAPPINVRRTEVRYRIVGSSYWETVAPIQRGTATNVVIFPLVSGAVYELQIRHITIHEIEGNWLSYPGNFTVGTTGNITYSGIVDASGKAIWTNITGSGKPSDNAGTSGVLTPIGNYSIVQGNTVTKTAAGTHGAYQGGAVGAPNTSTLFIRSNLLSAIGGGGWITIIALDDNAVNFNAASGGNVKYSANYTAITPGTGNVYLRINGTASAAFSVTGITLASRMSLIYDNTTVSIQIDGIVYISVPALPNLTLWPKVIDYYNSGQYLAIPIIDVLYGPWSDNAWLNIGGSGKPSDFATSNLKLTLLTSSGTTIIGNTIYNAVSNSYPNGVVSQPLFGSCYVEKDVIQNAYNAVALDNDGTSNDPTVLDALGIYYPVAGAAYIFINGIDVVNITITAGLTGKITLACDRVKLYLIIGGIIRATYPAPAVLSGAGAIYPKFFPHTPGYTYTGLAAGNYTSNLWADINGTGRPSDFATVGRNIIANGGAETGDTTNWRPYNFSGGAVFAASTSQPRISGAASFTMSKINAGDQLWVASRARPVQAGQAYTIRFWATAATLTANFYCRVLSFNGADPGYVDYSNYTYPGTEYVISSANGGSLENLSLTYAYVLYEGTWIAPAGANWASIIFINYFGGSPLFVIDDIEMVIGSQQTTEASPRMLDFAFTYAGVILSGQISQTVQMQRKIGANDVTSITAWTVTPTTGISCSISSAGLLSFTAVNNGQVVVTGVYGGVTQTTLVPITKTPGNPPSGSPAGSGATSASTSSFSAITSSSYVDAIGTGAFVIRAGSSGVVNLSAPLEFQRGNTGSNTAYGKWRWRVVGGTYADVATEITSQYDSFYPSSHAYGADPNPGYIEVTMSKTGLTNGVDYEFMLQLRSVGGGTVAFGGTASAVAA